MNWLKKIWKLYMLGAKANYFPIWKYGLFGRKMTSAYSKDADDGVR